MKQFSLFFVTICSLLLSNKEIVLAEKDQLNAFNIFTGEAIASANLSEEENKENAVFVRSPGKRSSAIPRPTLQVEQADKVWCQTKKLLIVTYNNSAEVKCGKDYQLDKIRYLLHDPPNIKSKSMDAKKLYTLVMLDPDAPDRENHLARNWLHWLLVDIAQSDISTGNDIVDYEPPEPPPGTGKHRYVFLLLEQDGPSAKRFTGGRTAFSIKRYAREHNLVSAVSAFTYFTVEEELK